MKIPFLELKPTYVELREELDAINLQYSKQYAINV